MLRDLVFSNKSILEGWVVSTVCDIEYWGHLPCCIRLHLLEEWLQVDALKKAIKPRLTQNHPPLPPRTWSQSSGQDSAPCWGLLQNPCSTPPPSRMESLKVLSFSSFLMLSAWHLIQQPFRYIPDRTISRWCLQCCFSTTCSPGSEWMHKWNNCPSFWVAPLCHHSHELAFPR